MDLTGIDEKDLNAYASLMRKLPTHTDAEDPDLISAFEEADRGIELLEKIKEPKKA
jgi:hypothetical protein